MASSAEAREHDAQVTLNPAAEFADVRLICNGGEVRGFACLLAGVSPVLRAALAAGRFKEGLEKTYNVNWASKAVVDMLVAFSCGCTPRIDGANAAETLVLADRLQVTSLHAACEEQLLALLTTSNAAQLSELADRHNCAKLKEVADAYYDAYLDASGSAALKLSASPDGASAVPWFHATS